MCPLVWGFFCFVWVVAWFLLGFLFVCFTVGFFLLLLTPYCVCQLLNSIGEVDFSPSVFFLSGSWSCLLHYWIFFQLNCKTNKNSVFLKIQYEHPFKVHLKCWILSWHNAEAAGRNVQVFIMKTLYFHLQKQDLSDQFKVCGHWFWFSTSILSPLSLGVFVLQEKGKKFPRSQGERDGCLM